MKKNNNKVVKNTILLYVRMILVTVISLVSVSIVLAVLGDVDYGTYNVVAGFVAMFSFVSGTLAVASQRYFAIGLANDDWKKVSKWFSLNIEIYVAFIIFVIIVAESIGLWFVLHKLTISGDRIEAAVWVYQFAIMGLIVSLISAPFQALLIADENLTLYSIASICEAIGKIAIVWILLYVSIDKLVLYGGLSLLLTVAVNTIYVVYPLSKYKELEISYVEDWQEIKSIFHYMKWNLIGAFGSVGKNQGITVIINMFFDPTANAARAISIQVSSSVTLFSQNFMKAVDPQITKRYVADAPDAYHKLLITSSKLSYYLLYIVVLPLIVNIEYILEIWLKGNAPEYTAIFIMLALIDALIISCTEPLSTGIQATGNVKMYQIIVGGLSVLNIPASYYCLKNFGNLMMPFYVAIFLSFAMSAGRVVIYNRLDTTFDIVEYLVHAFIPISVVTAITTLTVKKLNVKCQSFVGLVFSVVGIVLFSAMIIYLVGIDKEERGLLNGAINRMVKREAM